ncbi:UNVERIFIED_ORG: hypothetical protein M2435_006922 [Rhizobium sophorae]|uniref:hypothetical protein n=1 Tax=Rhizobium leguminosarum TaxID=384 RepID=UPI00161D336C|nr:hypothetical protein [Rhizobium leguminosarum]MBB4526841.1 hypothetical protein [Rhizobium leguminosarum]MDH6663975.1 hypothetical protein [Rhizobium sophorae]
MFSRFKRLKKINRTNATTREISNATYSAPTSTLVVEFSDGTKRTHIGVIQGYIVGLQIAANKVDFYESQIAPSNTALELIEDQKRLPSRSSHEA